MQFVIFGAVFLFPKLFERIEGTPPVPPGSGIVLLVQIGKMRASTSEQTVRNRCDQQNKYPCLNGAGVTAQRDKSVSGGIYGLMRSQELHNRRGV